ncbi:MAG: hypothetical protein IBX57_00845 [Gammaproteobacteria bacterium]|nr:hypothetical protein [Gammaproteobacteria bacterium]
MSSPFENFVNLELPKRVSTEQNPLGLDAGKIPISTGVGLGVEFKLPSEIEGINGSGNVGLVTARELPVDTTGRIILPSLPLGDILFNTVIVHLNVDCIVEIIGVTMGLEAGQAFVQIPVDDYNALKNDIASATVSYLSHL